MRTSFTEDGEQGEIAEHGARRVSFTERVYDRQSSFSLEEESRYTQSVPMKRDILPTWKGSQKHRKSHAPDLQFDEEMRINRLELRMHGGKRACFGQIQFVGAAASERPTPRYTCLSSETDAKEVLHLLDECWCLRKPSVLLSVTGSASNLSLEPRLEQLFKEGLREAAIFSSAWVITGGTDAGVMALAGEALSDQNLAGASAPPLIGIAPFGIVMHREKLQNAPRRKRLTQTLLDAHKTTETRLPTEQYNLLASRASGRHHELKRDLETTRRQIDEAYQKQRKEFHVEVKRERKESGQNLVGLEPNHTHFLLVDDGTDAPFGEIALRGELERACIERHHVPCVQLVLQGGIGTFQTVANALEHSCQVVLLEDSDGCARIIAEVVEPLLLKELPKEDGFRDKRVSDRLDEYYPKLLKALLNNSAHAQRADKALRTICFHLEHIHVYSFQRKHHRTADQRKSQRTFEQVILDAIIKSCKLDALAIEQDLQARCKLLRPMRPKPPPHVKARGRHPLYKVERLVVPDDRLDWMDDNEHDLWPGYVDKVPDFTHPTVRAQPSWADLPHPNNVVGLRERLTGVRTPMFSNERCMDKLKDVIQFEDGTGRPLNPRGRTGLRGRGLLGKWGPNMAADPIVTRYHPVTKELQMVAILRRDTGEWAIPGGMVDDGEVVSNTLRREFSEEAAASIRAASSPLGEDQSSDLLLDVLGDGSSSSSPDGHSVCDGPVKSRSEMLDELFAPANQTMVYAGYIDDPRNTDNAWMETTAVHFHCSTELARSLELTAGSDAKKVIWLDVTPGRDSRYANLYADHKKMVDHVVSMMKGNRNPMQALHYPARSVPSTYTFEALSEPKQGNLSKPLAGAEKAMPSPWSREVKDYNPTDWTQEAVEEHSGKWADPAVITKERLFERQTYEGGIGVGFEDYSATRQSREWLQHESVPVRPLNPRGRTGLKGRGSLGRWGPNHAVDAIVTRFHPVTRKLQIVLIKREDASEQMSPHKAPNQRGIVRRHTGFKRALALLKPQGSFKARGSALWSSRASHSGRDSRCGRPSAAAAASDERTSTIFPGLRAAVSSPSKLKGAITSAITRNRVVRNFGTAHRTAPLVQSELDTWALPGTMVEDGVGPPPMFSMYGTARRRLNDELMKHVRDTFISEAFYEVENSDSGKEEVMEHERERDSAKNMVEEEFTNGTVIYTGYVDDPRATDNAWIETTAVHVHCSFELGQKLEIIQERKKSAKHKSGIVKAVWADIDVVRESKMYALHNEWIDCVAERMTERTGLVKTLVSWNRRALLNEVLLDPELIELRDSRLHIQPAFEAALRKASSNQSFDVGVIELLIRHGASASDVDLKALFQVEANRSMSDPFLIMREMEQKRSTTESNNHDSLAKLVTKIQHTHHITQVPITDRQVKELRREEASAKSKPPVECGRQGSFSGRLRPKRKISKAGRAPVARRPRSIGLPEYTRIMHDEQRFERILPTYPIVEGSPWHAEHVDTLEPFIRNFREYALNASHVHYFELLIWSICCGATPLARKLWEKCLSPIRASLVSQAFCRKLKEKTLANAGNKQLLEDMESMFNRAGIGCLDEGLADKQLEVLLAIPTDDETGENTWHWQAVLGQQVTPGTRARRHGRKMRGSAERKSARKDGTIGTIGSSILDVALSLECKDFIAHSSCQAVIDDLWRGLSACCGPVRLQGGMQPPTWKLSLQIFFIFTFLRLLPTSHNHQHDSLLATDGELIYRYSGWQEMLAIFHIPLVKRIVWLLSHLGYCLLFVVVAFQPQCGPINAWHWTLFGWVCAVALHIGFQAMRDREWRHSKHMTWLELICCKDRAWWKLDIVSCVLLLLALALRLSLDETIFPTWQETRRTRDEYLFPHLFEAHADASTANGSVSPHDSAAGLPTPTLAPLLSGLAVNDEALREMECGWNPRIEVLQTILAIVALCLFARCSELFYLTPNSPTGVLAICTTRMISSTLTSWLPLMLLSSLAFGVGFNLLTPPRALDPDEPMDPWSPRGRQTIGLHVSLNLAADGPFWAPFWSVFDMWYTPDLIPGDAAFVAPLFVWMFLLANTVLLTNLLIAIFSQLYENISKDASQELRFMSVHMVNTYVTLYPVPPPFNLVALPLEAIYFLSCRISAALERCRPKALPAGEASGDTTLDNSPRPAHRLLFGGQRLIWPPVLCHLPAEKSKQAETEKLVKRAQLSYLKRVEYEAMATADYGKRFDEMNETIHERFDTQQASVEEKLKRVLKKLDDSRGVAWSSRASASPEALRSHPLHTRDTTTTDDRRSSVTEWRSSLTDSRRVSEDTPYKSGRPSAAVEATLETALETPPKPSAVPSAAPGTASADAPATAAPTVERVVPAAPNLLPAEAELIAPSSPDLAAVMGQPHAETQSSPDDRLVLRSREAAISIEAARDSPAQRRQLADQGKQTRRSVISI